MVVLNVIFLFRYLNFQPKDKSHGYGYIDPTWSSWGGNAVLGNDNLWHLFMAEIGQVKHHHQLLLQGQR